MLHSSSLSFYSEYFKAVIFSCVRSLHLCYIYAGGLTSLRQRLIKSVCAKCIFCARSRTHESSTSKILNIWRATDKLLANQIWPTGHMFEMPGVKGQISESSSSRTQTWFQSLSSLSRTVRTKHTSYPL